MKISNRKNELYNYAEITIRNETLRKINISEMCKNFGISKKTFYKEFESKENFIRKFYFKKLSEAYISLVSTIQKQDTFAEKIINISQVIENSIPIFNSNKLNEVAEIYPKVFERLINFKNNRVVPLFNLMISSAQKHNIINNYNSSIMLQVFFSVISSIHDSKRTLSIGENIKFNDVFQILLNGILTKKGKSFLSNKLVNIN
jgi:hypothetical protein